MAAISMDEEKVLVAVGSHGSVTAVVTPAVGASDWLFIYAPGAGSNVNDAFGRYASIKLADAGITSVRFQFPYAEAGRGRPDVPGVLEATWRAVIEEERPRTSRMAVGGRSMGGRIASQVVAKGMAVDALVLFAYPLHPPGRPEQLRDQHLSAITVPSLLCSGTRDAFGTPEELAKAASKLPNHHLHILDGADHGFTPLKASGRKRQDVWLEAVEAMLDWLQALR